MKKLLNLMGITSVVAVVALFNLKVALDNNQLNELLINNLQTFTQSGGESNNNGGNPNHYEHLLGRPKACTLYKFVGINGDVHIGGDDSNFGANYTKIEVTGIVELCPDKGTGCTVYSCKETN